ncbi:MAG TPA: hypothetical protein VMZ22_11265 [Acidimicrobiales bacterium]|nr:hypothetical protein [Acidimicrobiales bacterium]
MGNLYTAIVELATETDFVVTRSQLDVLGIGEKRTRTLRTNQFLQLVQRGVYLAGPAPPSWRQLARAACLAAGTDSWLSHVAALRWRGFTVPEHDNSIHISAPRSDGPVPRDVVVHRPTRPVKVFARDGIRIASIEDALLDFAATADRATLEIAVESALLSRKTHERKIWRTIALNSRQGVRGVALLRFVMEHRPAGKPARSILELEVLGVLRRAGLPLPTRNHDVIDGNGDKREIDLCYVLERGAIEADSKAFHSTATQTAKDCYRQRALEAVGFTFVRVTWADVFQRPDWIVAEVTALLGGVGVHYGRQVRPEAS